MLNYVIQGRDTLLKTAEIALAVVVFICVAYFSVSALSNFLHKDWSSVATMYEFISVVLLILLGLEIVRLILVHSITVVMELMLLITARKMLYPDIEPLGLLFCVLAFCLVIGVYYLYELKPLENLNDLTK